MYGWMLLAASSIFLCSYVLNTSFTCAGSPSGKSFMYCWNWDNINSRLCSVPHHVTCQQGHRWQQDGGEQRRHWDLWWCSLSCLTTKVFFCSSKFYLLVIILMPLWVGQYLIHIYCWQLKREGITKVHTILLSHKLLIPVFDTFLFHMFISCRWIYIPPLECWTVLPQTWTCLVWS